MLMKLLLAFFIIGSLNAYADEPRRTVESAATVDSLGTVVSTIAVASTATVITKSSSLVGSTVAGSVGIMYKATSPGVVNLSIQALRSYDRPTTEGSTDSKYVVWNGPFTTTDTAWHMATLDTIVEPFFRFVITGAGSNDASTTVQIKVAKQ